MQNQSSALLTEFFNHYGKAESRLLLWKWYRTTVCHNYHELEPREMAAILEFYDALDELLGELAACNGP